MDLFVESPRTLVFQKTSHRLSIRAVEVDEKSCKVEVNYGTGTSSGSHLISDILAILGVLGTQDDVYVALVTKARAVAWIEMNPIYIITEVKFISLTTAQFDYYMSVEEEDMIPCAEIARIIQNSYFSYKFDLSRSAQSKMTMQHPDTDYIWNTFMLKPILHVFEKSMWKAAETGMIVHLIQGYVGLIEEKAKICLISRVNCRRCGTRYLTRGLDDEGYVANSVETELLCFVNDQVLSHVITRGSIPIFWEQQGIQIGGHKIQVTRSKEATTSSFQRHINQMATKYRGPITSVSLVSKEQSEAVLGLEFRRHYVDLMQTTPHRLIEFDFHALARADYMGLNDLLCQLAPFLQEQQCFVQKKEMVQSQMGVFRVNCVDCLDRTNVVQGMISERVLKGFIGTVPAQFKHLWADNGDAISRIYAGTAALKSGYTRSGKRTIMGVLEDSIKTVNRFVINNFSDKSRQEAFDIMLGKIIKRRISIPEQENIDRELQRRITEYQSTVELTIRACTFNVNGKLPNQSIRDFIMSHDVLPHIIVIGIQEIVELTAGQIVATDLLKKQEWIDILKNEMKQYSEPFELLCDNQLVGAAIFLFARKTLTPFIKELESAKVKTGLYGMAGNKGGIALRFLVHSTRLCFVTAHLAAGQFAVDRNNDYNTIESTMRFKMGQGLLDCDHCIWLGDLNYRLDLDFETVQAKMKNMNFDYLLQKDQLNQSKRMELCFQGYKEPEITFPPTYRLCHDSDFYDSQRVPAWCDRILYKTKGGLTNTHYFSPKISFSDHKPVCAIFQLEATIVDTDKKQQINAKPLIVFD